MANHPFDLAPMFEKARAEGLWFRYNYQVLWFSPDELESQHDKGYFQWGSVNWELRNPEEGIEELVRKIVDLEFDMENFRERILESKRDKEDSE